MRAVATLPFLLEGVRPETADARVRNLVQTLTPSLQDFQQVRRHSGARRGLKAYRFDVNAADEAVVMNPATCPTGLRVRPWTVKPAVQQHTVNNPSGLGRSENHRRQEPTLMSSDRRLAANPMTPHRPHSHADGPAAVRRSPKQSGITGSGPASELVEYTDDAHGRTAAFLVDGILPEASDAQVRNLVWPLVSNLHQCHKARRGGMQVGTKAYRIVVDSADTTAVLNAANRPAGLRVYSWSEQQTQPL